MLKKITSSRYETVVMNLIKVKISYLFYWVYVDKINTAAASLYVGMK